MVYNIATCNDLQCSRKTSDIIMTYNVQENDLYYNTLKCSSKNITMFYNDLGKHHIIML